VEVRVTAVGGTPAGVQYSGDAGRLVQLDILRCAAFVAPAPSHQEVPLGVASPEANWQSPRINPASPRCSGPRNLMWGRG